MTEVAYGALGPGPVRQQLVAPTAAGSTSGYVIVPIANDGDRPLQIGRVSLRDGRSFRIDGALGMPVMLRPGAVLPLRIEFQPLAAGEALDTLVIESGDASQPSTEIGLSGTAR